VDPEKGIEYISSTEVKNWIYCPLILFYRKVTRLEPKIHEQQRAGMEKHLEIQNKIKKRASIATRKKELRDYPKRTQ